MTTRELLLSCWTPDPLAIVGCAAAVLVYVLTSPGRGSATAARAIAFAVGLTVLALALVSPIGSLAEGYLFSAHMLQHLLLVLVVPPLLLLGFEPSGQPSATGNRRRVRIPAVVPWGLGVGAMWLWHAPTLCNAASQSALVHRVQEVSLLAMGAAFFWPVLSPRTGERLPPLGGVVYLFTACVSCTVLAVAITFSPVEVCSVFAHPVDRLGVMPLVRDGWGLTAQRDQQIGGLLMWLPACLVYGAAILAVLARVLGEAVPVRSNGASEAS
jgi:cytochrome c oxidase assembly factor CtaG